MIDKSVDIYMNPQLISGSPEMARDFFTGAYEWTDYVYTAQASVKAVI
jgi:hypothetical protein